MQKFTTILILALFFSLASFAFPKLAGKVDTLPQPVMEASSSARTIIPAPTSIPEVPYEVEAYMQVWRLQHKTGGQDLPLGAGVCVDRVSLAALSLQWDFCYVLSAAHVCSSIDTQHEGGDIYGNRFPITVVDTHPFLDLCLIRAHHRFPSEVDTIDMSPVRYGDVYNYSAPLGSFEDGSLWLLPLFTGVIHGYTGNLREHLLTSVPVHRGSSGSALYRQGMLAGIITQRNSAFEHFSYAIRGEYLAQYLLLNGIQITLKDSPSPIAQPPR